MLERFKKEPDPAIQGQIDAVIEEMKQYGPTSPEYPTLMKHLEGLNDLMNAQRSKPISRDTMLIVGGNLLLGLLMLNYEKTGVITSKVQALVVRPMK
jgi:hypothetical protein